MIRVLIIVTLLFSACQEKSKPVIIKNSSLNIPIKCMSLNRLEVEEKFISELERLYSFSSSCNYRLNISYKKDIVCNSSYNAVAKTTGKFPKSYLKFELRDGMRILYSYYIDLYDNVDIEDIRDGFLKLRTDLLNSK